MAYPVVMARAYRGEPWRCLAMQTTDRAAFLISPDSLSAIEAGELGPVGFPIEDVFEFDADLYQQLREQWEREGRTDGALWRSAQPYSKPRAVRYGREDAEGPEETRTGPASRQNLALRVIT
jgi:hypothetical protein